MKTQTIPTKEIYGQLKTFPYIWIISPVKTWFNGITVGWNCHASSEIRKPYTLMRMQEEIDKLNIPLIVEDGNGRSFRLMIKL